MPRPNRQNTMKNRLLALILPFTASLFAAPLYLPVVSSTVVTAPLGTQVPECQVSIRLTPDFKHIAKASLRIGEESHDFPAEALSGIEFPNLSSLRVETEQGRDGKRWVSIVLSPAGPSEHPTRFHISVIDGKFARVSKSWDEPQGRSIRRQSKILHVVE